MPLNIFVAIVTLVSLCRPTYGAEQLQSGATGQTASSESSFDWKRCVMELRGRRLSTALDGYDPEQMKDQFYQGRVGHTHNAVDMLAPRNTAVHAVEDGSIGRLFESEAGGLTIYQKDPTGKFVYYYAHLENYAEGLKDGDSVRRGQIIGYVGTSGNAPPSTPHLHFAISAIGPDGSIFKGRAFDPYEVYTKDLSAVGRGALLASVETEVMPLGRITGKPVEQATTRNRVSKGTNKTAGSKDNKAVHKGSAGMTAIKPVKRVSVSEDAHKPPAATGANKSATRFARAVRKPTAGRAAPFSKSSQSKSR